MRLTLKPVHFVVLVLLLGGCKKETRESLTQHYLTSAKWQRIVYYLSASTGGLPLDTTNAQSLFKQCEQDNLAIFRPDGAFIIDEGKAKCDSVRSQQWPHSSWHLLDGDTKLHVMSTSYDIKQIGRDTLELDYQLFAPNGGRAREHIVYVRVD